MTLHYDPQQSAAILIQKFPEQWQKACEVVDAIAAKHNLECHFMNPDAPIDDVDAEVLADPMRDISRLFYKQAIGVIDKSYLPHLADPEDTVGALATMAVLRFELVDGDEKESDDD